MPTLDFDTGTPGDLIPFTVRGVDPNGGKWVEEFHCLSDIPATVMWEVEEASVRAKRGEPMTSRDVVMPFFEAALPPEDYARFVTTIRERQVGAAYLTVIMQGLAGAVSDRPTKPSSPSWDGRGVIPTTSAAASASPPPVLPPPASPTSV